MRLGHSTGHCPVHTSSLSGSCPGDRSHLHRVQWAGLAINNSGGHRPGLQPGGPRRAPVPPPHLGLAALGVGQGLPQRPSCSLACLVFVSCGVSRRHRKLSGCLSLPSASPVCGYSACKHGACLRRLHPRLALPACSVARSTQPGHEVTLPVNVLVQGPSPPGKGTVLQGL